MHRRGQKTGKIRPFSGRISTVLPAPRITPSGGKGATTHSRSVQQRGAVPAPCRAFGSRPLLARSRVERGSEGGLRLPVAVGVRASPSPGRAIGGHFLPLAQGGSRGVVPPWRPCAVPDLGPLWSPLGMILAAALRFCRSFLPPRRFCGAMARGVGGSGENSALSAKLRASDPQGCPSCRLDPSWDPCRPTGESP